MGQVIFYMPLPESDGISATANANGFTTLTAIARRWDIPLDHIKNMAEHANKVQKKCPWSTVIEEPTKHTLYIIPKSRGDSDSKAITTKLLQDASIEQTRILEFSHYNFVQNRLPITEINAALDAILAWKGNKHPSTVIFDIDSRFEDEFQNLYAHAK